MFHTRPKSLYHFSAKFSTHLIMTTHTGVMISLTLQFSAAINMRGASSVGLINYTLMKSDRGAAVLDSSTLLSLPFTFQDSK